MKKVKRSSNITPEIIEVARSLAPIAKAGGGITDGCGRVCGLGLLLVAADESPGRFSTNGAMDHFGLYTGGAKVDYDRCEIWERFDAAVYENSNLSPADRKTDEQLFNEWLDWVAANYL